MTYVSESSARRYAERAYREGICREADKLARAERQNGGR